MVVSEVHLAWFIQDIGCCGDKDGVCPGFKCRSNGDFEDAGSTSVPWGKSFGVSG